MSDQESKILANQPLNGEPTKSRENIQPTSGSENKPEDLKKTTSIMIF